MSDKNGAGSFAMGGSKQPKTQSEAGYAEQEVDESLRGTSSSQAREILNQRQPENEYMFGSDPSPSDFVSFFFEIPKRIFHYFNK